MYDEKQMLANPVGTGPYRLVDWRRSSRMVFEKNPGYREDFYNEAGHAGRRQCSESRRE